ncbi:LOW QUALITY PROTEIN: RYamide neuropeptides, partial [Drosophila teissieri]|uniref:LOW QUALITY PROTEIN: RYamide neuropeptides n=1 Tax=Drosophila teissieri TaxID=7243 RepID=UPI001CB9F624
FSNSYISLSVNKFIYFQFSFYFFLGIQKRSAFFVGSRYGRSGSTTYDESLKSRRIFIVPRNEHFFLGSRYGKRSGKYLRLMRGINMLIVRKGFGNNGKERTLYLSFIIILILMRNT